MQTKVRTNFHYLYRDAGSFKVYGLVALEGQLGEHDRRAIINAMDLDGRFVAEQIGVPALYGPLHKHTDGPSHVDVCTHEFLHFEEVVGAWPSDDDCSVWGEAKDFVSIVRSIPEWNFRLSVNAKQLFASNCS